ncbi:MAG: HAD family hydrolase [Planctomycetota bacterium]
MFTGSWSKKRAGGFRPRLAVVLLVASASACGARADEPLPSWKPGVAKSAVLDFVAAVTDEDSPAFVPAAERVAVFDNDGTLWPEKPYYFQLQFAIDRVKSLAPNRPEWRERPAIQAAIRGDMAALAESGHAGVAELVMASHAGMTTDEFAAAVRGWFATARHPRFDRPYNELTYLSMLEVLRYLRSHGFKTYIVSGGGVEFLRVFAEDAYGIPPEQVIGSTIKTRFEFRKGKPVLARLAEIDFVDDKAGKPVAINRHIGRRPIAAFGNSDGDLQMLQWTAAGAGRRLCVLVHHTDAQREWAYDRESAVGKLDKAIDEAAANGWTFADMKQDWAAVFSTGKAGEE